MGNVGHRTVVREEARAVLVLGQDETAADCLRLARQREAARGIRRRVPLSARSCTVARWRTDLWEAGGLRALDDGVFAVGRAALGRVVVASLLADVLDRGKVHLARQVPSGFGAALRLWGL